MPKNKTISRICKTCGIEFFVYPSQVAKGYAKFCSMKCKAIGSLRPAAPRACKTCGTEFVPIPYAVKIGKGVFCSRKCIRSPLIPPDVRFWRHVSKTDKCWL